MRGWHLMSDSQMLASVLRRVAVLVAGLTDRELEDIVSGRARIVVEGRRARSKASPTSSTAGLAHVREQLLASDSREDGLQVLERAQLSKASLERLARELDLPVSRRDTSDSLRSRVVEGTIGYRLRSNAVSGRSSPQSGRVELNETPDPSPTSGPDKASAGPE